MAERIKALFLTFYFNPDLCAGSFRASAIVKELSKQSEFEWHVITTMPNRYIDFKADKADHEQISEKLKITRIDIPSHKSGILDQIRSFGYFYRQAISIAKTQNYDFVFATSSRVFTAFLGAKIARKNKAILYLDIRDLARDTLVDLYKPPINYFLNLVLKKVEHYTFKTANHINVVSEGFQKYISKHYFGKKSSVFTNGIDPEFMNFQLINQKMNRQKSKTDLIHITYAGNVGAGQALEKIVPQLALELKSKVVFKIVGSGSRIRLLKNKVEELQIKNVVIIDPIQRSKLMIEYQNADILFIHLNDIRAFEKVLPSKIFEYAATGKPILAGVNGYARQFLLENVSNCSVFQSGNIKEAVEAIKTIDLSSRSRVSFKNKFDREAITRNMVKDIIRVFQDGA